MNITRRISSSAISKRVVASSVTDLGGGSTRASICWRGNSYVAAREPSDLPKERRGKVPLEERKAMVASYVNEYRAMNSGKFPPPSIARKQVGGSYYIIRKLIQELHHQDKISTMSTVETHAQGDVIKTEKRFSGTHQLSTSNVTTYKNVYQDGQTRDADVSSKETETLSSVQLPLAVTVQEENPIYRDTQASPEIESAKNDKLLHEAEEIQFFPSESDEKNAESFRESVVSIVGSDLLKSTKNEAEEIQFFQSESIVTLEENSRESAANNIGSDPPKATNAQVIGTSLVEKMQTPSSPDDKTQVENLIDDKIKVETADFQEYFHNAQDNVKIQDSPEPDKLKPEPDQLHQTHKLGTVNRDLSRHHSEAGNTSNMWDNLKSFAGGIFSFFRKK